MLEPDKVQQLLQRPDLTYSDVARALLQAGLMVPGAVPQTRFGSGKGRYY